jgi:hypothetical protein
MSDATGGRLADELRRCLPRCQLGNERGGAPVMAVLIPVVSFYIRLRLDPLAHRQRTDVRAAAAAGV